MKVAFCLHGVAAFKMKITPEFLLLLPPGLFWIYHSKISAEDGWKSGKAEAPDLRAILFFYPYSPFQTLIQYLSHAFCVTRPGLELSILICVKSLFSWDLFLLSPPTLLSLSIVSPIFMSPWILYCNIFSLLLIVIRTKALFFSPTVYVKHLSPIQMLT